MGVCLTLNVWSYMLPLGLASAVNTSVSNALGAGDAARAKRVFHVGLAAAVALQALIIAGIIAGREQLVGLLCTDAAVVASCVAVLPLVACELCLFCLFVLLFV